MDNRMAAMVEIYSREVQLQPNCVGSLNGKTKVVFRVAASIAKGLFGCSREPTYGNFCGQPDHYP
jgi:hypothetical protein